MSTEPWELVENPTRYDEYNWDSDDIPTRKFYLFLAEIGRRLRHLMTQPGPIKMIDFCEQCAEGQITEGELSDLSDEHRTYSPSESYDGNTADNLYYWVADRYKVNTRGVYYAAEVFAFQAAVQAGILPSQPDSYDAFMAIKSHPIVSAASDATALEWGILVREIYGPNPFLPIRVEPAWLNWNDCTVTKLAQNIYDQCAFDTMPILADALEDAGCDNTAILDHLRKPGNHMRGCWALDVLLDKK